MYIMRRIVVISAISYFAAVTSFRLEKQFGDKYNAALKAAPSNSALLVIDMQHDFMTYGNHTGSLSVKDGHTLIDTINNLVKLDGWKHIVFSEDEHPAEHISFAETHNLPPFNPVQMQWTSEGKLCNVTTAKPEGFKFYKELYKDLVADECGASPVSFNQMLWPTHCVKDTKGQQTAMAMPERAYLVKKGKNPVIDSYSAIQNNIHIPTWEGEIFMGHQPEPSLTWESMLSDVENVYVVGLALDYCVKSTAIDAKKALGKNTFIVKDASKPVWPEDNDIHISAMKEAEGAGVTMMESSQLLGNKMDGGEQDEGARSKPATSIAAQSNSTSWSLTSWWRSVRKGN